jgi:hypothetical protein
MRRKFRYAGELLATFSPTQPNMIVLAGAALGVGVYFFDFHIGQVQSTGVCVMHCVQVHHAWPATAWTSDNFALTQRFLQVVQQFVDMDQVATALALSPSGYLITIGTDDRLVKVVDYDEVLYPHPCL